MTTPSQAKTREEWEGNKAFELSWAMQCAKDRDDSAIPLHRALNLLASEVTALRTSLSVSELEVSRLTTQAQGYTLVMDSLQASVTQLEGDKWLLNRKVEIALDEYGKLKASETKTQADNQELRAEVERLGRVNREWAAVSGPVLDFGHENADKLGIRLGESVMLKALELMQEKARQPK